MKCEGWDNVNCGIIKLIQRNEAQQEHRKKIADLLSLYNRFRTALRWNNSTSYRKCHGNWWICTVLQSCHPFPPQFSWASPSQLSLGAAHGSNVLPPPSATPRLVAPPESLGRHLHCSEGQGAAPGSLLILPPCRSKYLLETPLSISLTPRHLLWECQNVGISWNKAITRTDRINPRITWRANTPCLGVLPWLQPFRGTFSLAFTQSRK